MALGLSLSDADFRQRRVLITGTNGQLGWELLRTAPKGIEVIATDSSTLDVQDQRAVGNFIKDSAPEIIINAAAYTAVDKAEEEIELAYAVNATGAGYLAEAAGKQGARLIHISTDFVFDGEQSHPYLPDDLPNPMGVYGASKYEGEKLVRENTQDQAAIIRTSWVYSIHGQNFVKTMLKLMSEREELSVVADQVGTPTWAKGLAQAIWQLTLLPQIRGILCWTDAGVASWYDFAVAIQQEALISGVLSQGIPIKPITSKDYPTPAQRPAYSVLDKTKTWSELGIRSPHWGQSLKQFFEDFRN